MGCDTHIYIEYREKNVPNRSWQSFGRKLNPGRNYTLFGMMATVRCEPDFRFEPKGMPHDAGFHSLNDNRLYICDSEGEDHATMEQAEGWAKRGSAEIIYQEDRPTWVTHPDWHSHSWLSSREFTALMDTYNRTDGYYRQPEYDVLLACLLKFEDLGYDSRIVFWFDN